LKKKLKFGYILLTEKKIIKMRHFITLLVIITATSSCVKINNNASDVKDQMIPVDLTHVKVGGEIGRRIDATISNNLLLLNVDTDFLSSFQKKNDYGYIGLGKLIDGAVKMAAYSNDEKVISLKDHLIGEIIKAQETDGYIGNMTPLNRIVKLWDIHEMGYIINGLITDFTLFGDKESLRSAREAADYIIENWSKIPADWGEKTGVTEHVAITGLHRTIYTLFLVTKENRYLDFCLNELNLRNLDPPIVIGRRRLIEGHIYGFMAASLAQLELFRMKPDEKLLVPAMRACHFLTSENGMSISGGAGQSEIWTDDQDGRGDLGESCATVYLLRVYDNLLRLKNDSRFGDIMERTIYNALFGAQSPDGRQIRYFTPLEGDRRYHNGDTYCCPCNYRRFISELPSMIYYKVRNGVAINLYSSSNADISLDNNCTVNIKQETDYPNSGHVVININPSEDTSFPLIMRIPSWCRDARISVNGQPLDYVCRPGTFAEIGRLWKAGDQVVLDMPMEWRLVKGRERQSGRVAIMRGPLLFCLNPDQNETLAKLDAADLSRIVIDKSSIDSLPVSDNSVRPDGIACRLKAGTVPMALGNSRNISLTLTEFADPDGKCTYFMVPDLSEAVTDELIGLW
jgi:DUF1680 family protein